MLKLISDLDNTLYEDPPDATHAMREAAIDTAIEEFSVQLSRQDICTLIDQSYAERPFWTDLLMEKFDIDLDYFLSAYHRRLDHKQITPYPKLRHYFNSLSDGEASHVMLTHSNADWASRATEHIELRPWYPDDRILSWEKYKESKSAGRKGFVMALEILDVVNPEEATFVDDSLRNLVTAKLMGMKTAWISHGRPLPKEYLPYVDHVVGNIEIFMAQYIALHASKPQRAAAQILRPPLPSPWQ